MLRNWKSCSFLIVFIVVSFTMLSAQSNPENNFTEEFERINQYAQIGHDSTTILLAEIKDQINFDPSNEIAFEFLILQIEFHEISRRKKEAQDLLVEARSYYESSENEKLNLRFDLVHAHVNESEIDDYESYVAQLLERAKHLNDPSLIITSKLMLSRVFHRRLSADTANILIQESIDQAQENNLNSSIANAYHASTRMEYERSNYEKALELSELAIANYDAVNNQLGTASILNIQAIIYRKRGLYNKSLQNLKKVLTVYEAHNATYSIGTIHNNIGLLLEKIGESESAVKSFKLAKGYIERNNDIRSMSFINNNIAISYTTLGQYEKAESFFLESIAVKEEREYLFALTFSYNKLGLLYLKQLEYSKAKEQFNKAFELAKKIESTRELTETYLGLATVGLVEGEYQKSIEYCEKALSIAEENKDLDDQLDAFKKLADAHGKIGGLEKSIYYFKAADVLKDSLISKAKYQEMAVMTDQYEEQYKEEIEIIRLENENLKKDAIIQASSQRTRFLGTLFLAGLFLLGGVVWNSKQKQKTNRELESLNFALQESNKKILESNTQLQQFAHIASHDLKSPIISITSFASLLKSKAKDKLDEKENKFLDFIESSGKNLTRLVDDLLEYSKVNSQKINRTQINGDLLIKEVFSLLSTQADQRKVSLKQLNPFPIFQGDEIKIKRVFQNLISNAVKFSDHDKDAYIHISCTQSDGYLTFNIVDNGIGIKKTTKDIFEPFTYLNNSSEYKGTGMGLAFCKKIIEQHEGSISYTSEFGEGTQFTFSIKQS